MSSERPGVVKPEVFAALAEPNRLRIVQLLGTAPRPVGEIAIRLKLRQPQVTKHLQTLERAGLVTAHPLGRRRIYALRRDTLRGLAQGLAALDIADASDDALRQYEAAISAETALAATRRSALPRRFEFVRDFAAPAARVWRAWTSADDVRLWWAPTHFSVVECVVTPAVGGPLRVVMEEADGTRYPSTGRFLGLHEPKSLSFELAPLDEQARPLFDAVFDVQLVDRGASTRLTMTIEVTNATSEATVALAGIEMGWDQLFDKLAALVAG